jgi:chromosome segregation ATPase
MSDSETLSLLRSIDGRLGNVEIRLGGIETRVGAIETRVGAIETRLSGVETRLSGLETRLETLESVTARAPDLRLLGHQMATLIERVTGLEASNTRAIAALNDIARESVTPGEVEALHSEMNELRNAKFNHEVRIRQLEAELNIAPSS